MTIHQISQSGGIRCLIKLTLFLNSFRYTIVSTGGTASALEAVGVSVTKVEELTHFPEMVIVFILYFFVS